MMRRSNCKALSTTESSSKSWAKKDTPPASLGQRRRFKKNRRSTFSRCVLGNIPVLLLVSLLYAAVRKHQRKLASHARHRRAEDLQHRLERIALDKDSALHLFSMEFSSFRSKGGIEKENEASENVKSRRLVLQRWLNATDTAIVNNLHSREARWVSPWLLPPLNSQESAMATSTSRNGIHILDTSENKWESSFSIFWVNRSGVKMVWEGEAQNLDETIGPPVDYTDRTLYRYPDLLEKPDDSYPSFQKLSDLMAKWSQHEDYAGADGIQETLMHFNFSNPEELEMARRFRDAELPFKLYDIPELDAVTKKWTDSYLNRSFMTREEHLHWTPQQKLGRATGYAQESTTQFFPFYRQPAWSIRQLGIPPSRNNDWRYATWARHARYADAARLPYSQPHFYWHSIVEDERGLAEQNRTFVSRDLPFFCPRKPNFFRFDTSGRRGGPSDGIQCRMGERGIAVANHYDAGRNMVAMIRGAKRYLLFPPTQCQRLGIVMEKHEPMVRQSILNYGNLPFLDDAKVNGMSDAEHAWLSRAATTQAVQTVVKAGEILYIPSHWFHYIISLQKSAQCNAVSGPPPKGRYRFGVEQPGMCKGFVGQTTS